jgi:hypothetical protein
MAESRKQTFARMVLWRLIGIVWTWIGAYPILMLTGSREVAGHARHVPTGRPPDGAWG